MSQTKSRWSIGRLLREAAIFAVMIFAVSNLLSYIRAPKLDSDSLPIIEAKFIDGNIINMKKYQGKPLLINFWGTWCPVCKQESPSIDTVSKQYNVISVAVNSRSDNHIKDWMRDRGVSYPVINDIDGKWAERFKVKVFPTNFIYDSNGKLKFTETGYSTTAGLLARMALAK